MSASDDFFSNELNRPPKPAVIPATPTPTPTPPPPPPPRPATGNGNGNGNGNGTGNSSRIFSAPVPVVPAVAVAVAVAAATRTARPAARSRTKARPTTTTSTDTFFRPPANTSANTSAVTSTTSMPRKTVPVMSRPVGTYYGSTPASTPAVMNPSTSTPAATPTATNTNTSYYGNTTTMAAAEPSSESNTPGAADTWDWTSPAATAGSGSGAGAAAPASSTNQWAAPAPAVAANPNQWAASAPAPSSVPITQTTTSNNGWYSDGGGGGSSSNTTTTTTAASAYATPGYGNNSSSNNNKNAYYPGQDMQQQQQQPQMHQQQQPFLAGSMEPVTGRAPSLMQPQTFVPQQPNADNNYDHSMNMDDRIEPPLLEELGINVSHILLKIKAVILPFSRFHNQQDGQEIMDPAMICKDADLAGPIANCMLLGGEMVLAGKLQFGYIYGFGLFGCLSMTIVVNLMTPSDSISVWTVASVLGYALIPVNLLAAVKLIVVNVIQLQTLGRILGLLTVAWSTTASTRMLELGCGLREQRYLIAYPIALLYSAFVLITIF